MKTQKPEKRVPRRSEDDFEEFQDYPKKSRGKKPKRGRKDFFSDYDNNDKYDDDEY